MNKGKLAVLAVIAGLVAAFFVFDLRQYVTIEYFQSQRALIEAYFQEHPVQTGLAFFLVNGQVPTRVPLFRAPNVWPGRMKNSTCPVP